MKINLKWPRQNNTFDVKDLINKTVTANVIYLYLVSYSNSF
jgi:hypothetical protein